MFQNVQENYGIILEKYYFVIMRTFVIIKKYNENHINYYDGLRFMPPSLIVLLMAINYENY